MRTCAITSISYALLFVVGAGAFAHPASAKTAVSLGVTASGVQSADGAMEGGTETTGPSQYHPAAVKAIDELYSPYCPGFMLEICTAAASEVLRDSINAYANEGWSAEELVEWMVGNHGEQYRAVPLRSGWGMWAWILPPAGIALGLTVIFLFLRHKVRSTSASGKVQRGRGAPGVVSSEEEEKLRSAIREIELNEDPSF